MRCMSGNVFVVLVIPQRVLLMGDGFAYRIEHTLWWCHCLCDEPSYAPITRYPIHLRLVDSLYNRVDCEV